MQEARNWLSVEPVNNLIRVYTQVEGKEYHEVHEYRFHKPLMSLGVLSQLAIGRWMEVDLQMLNCIRWIEKQLGWINERHGTNFSLQSRRLSVHRPCQFGLVGG